MQGVNDMARKIQRSDTASHLKALGLRTGHYDILEHYWGNGNAVIGVVDGVRRPPVMEEGFLLNPHVQNPFGHDRYLVLFFPHYLFAEFGVGNDVIAVGNYAGKHARGDYKDMPILDAQEVINLSTRRAYRINVSEADNYSSGRLELNPKFMW